MDDIYKKGIRKLAKEATLHPAESPLVVRKNNNSLFIGLPNDPSVDENRILLTPDAVRLLINNGHQVWIESGAGNKSKYSDREYSDAGAKICYSPQEIFQADIILRVNPLTEDEISLVKKGTTVITTLQHRKLNKAYLEKFLEKKITAVALSLLEDKVGSRPVVRAMSEIAGSTVLLIASEYLSTTKNGIGMILGGVTGVPPTSIVILGAGSVAEHAARAAIGLGADVKIFANHIYKLRRLKQALNSQLYTAVIEPVLLTEALKSADVVIGAIRSDDDRAPCVVSEDMIRLMKPGSIIIDVSIDQGGCFETSKITTHSAPIFALHDVLHYCVPNIASRVARTASMALSNIFGPLLLQIGKAGGVDEMVQTKDWLMKGVYTYKGCLTNYNISKRYDIKFNDLKFLFSTRF